MRGNLARILAACGLTVATPPLRYGARTLVPAILVVNTGIEGADNAACDAAMEFNARQRLGRNGAVLYLCEASGNTPIDDGADVPGTLSGLTCDAREGERPTSIRNQRVGPAHLTAGYIAKGVGEFLHDLRAGRFSGNHAEGELVKSHSSDWGRLGNPDAPLAAGAFEGELEFMDAVLRHADELDRKADAVDAEGGFTGVFVYEVAEPFGYDYAKALHQAGTSGPAPHVATELMDRLISQAKG